MKKYVKICGRTFEECKSKLDGEPMIHHRGIFTCYDRPSNTKINIWMDWADWFNANGSVKYGIPSYNCNFFTVDGIIRDSETGILWYVYITYAHSKAYRIG